MVLGVMVRKLEVRKQELFYWNWWIREIKLGNIIGQDTTGWVGGNGYAFKLTAMLAGKRALRRLNRIDKRLRVWRARDDRQNRDGQKNREGTRP